MKWKKKINFCIVVLIIGLATCTLIETRTYHIKDYSINENDITEDFKEIHQTIKRKYSLLSHKGINPDTLFSIYYPRIKEAQNGQQYLRLIQQYLAELKNSHTNIGFRRYRLNNRTVIVEDRLFFSYVGEKVFLENGVNQKDEIIEINHIPAMEWLNQEKRFISASTDISATDDARRSISLSYFPEERQFLIRTANGIKEISVLFGEPKHTNGEPATDLPHSLIKSDVFFDSIGYISIEEMEKSALDDFIIAYKSVKDKPHLIIDIRSNGGGNSGISERIASYLLKKEHRACVSKKLLKPKPNSYNGTLYLLISNYTFSSAESFAIDLKEGAKAILVGEPTAGDTGNKPKYYTSKYNTRIRIPTRPPEISAHGFPMEGKSIEPEYLVMQTIDDFLDDRDTALDFVLDLINSIVTESRNHGFEEPTYVSDIEGNMYLTLRIGNQIWMAENLKTTLYNDGSKIPTTLSNQVWRDTRQGAFSLYPHENIRDLNSQEEVMNYYGILYNWFAVADSRGLCPAGWKIPSDDDWSQLTDYLIENFVDITYENTGNVLKSCRQINSPAGEECNTTLHPRWNPNPTNHGLDKLGFSAMPGGYRFAYGDFYNLGSLGGFWSSTEDSEANAWVRFLRDNSGFVNRLSYDKTSGFSVRCIRNDVVPDRVP